MNSAQSQGCVDWGVTGFVDYVVGVKIPPGTLCFEGYTNMIELWGSVDYVASVEDSAGDTLQTLSNYLVYDNQNVLWVYA